MMLTVNLHKLKIRVATIKQQGFTMIEVLVIMTVIAILATLGISAFTGFQKSAQLISTINEMRNMVNVVAEIKKGYAKHASSTTFIRDRIVPASGDIKYFNILHNTNMPLTNSFGLNKDERGNNRDYKYTMIPRVSISTKIPMVDISPAGFNANTARSIGDSTILTVYPRAIVGKKILNRYNWVKDFYYGQYYKELTIKQTANKFKPNYLKGTYAPP